jgi:hypothetical protein
MVKTLVMVTGAIALVGSMAGRAEARGADTHPRERVAVEKEAIELVEQVEEVGWDVRYHAERLAQFARTPEVSRWTHYHHLDQIKALVNDNLRPALERQTEIQGRLPEWKQESVDRMLASARELSAEASSAFAAKTENPNVPAVMNDDYKKRVDGMRTHAEALTKTADAARTFAAARLKAAEAGLNVPK